MTQDLPFEMPVKRPPLRYHGGKFRIAPWVVSHFPKHRAYVEVFGGAAGVLLRKARSYSEHYNDLDGMVVSFFEILRNPIARARLCEVVALTPFSREEFKRAYEFSSDPIEAARRLVVRCHSGHGTCSMDPEDSNGFRSGDHKAGKSYAREWCGIPEALAVAGQRFQGVTIENMDFRRIIPRMDDADTLFYIDPPYVSSTRVAGGKGYVHEMTDEDHRQLAWLLKACKGKVVLSGYDCRLYRELYADWRSDSKTVCAAGQLGGVSRTEFLWMNFPEEKLAGGPPALLS